MFGDISSRCWTISRYNELTKHICSIIIDILDVRLVQKVENVDSISLGTPPPPRYNALVAYGMFDVCWPIIYSEIRAELTFLTPGDDSRTKLTSSESNREEYGTVSWTAPRRNHSVTNWSCSDWETRTLRCAQCACACYFFNHINYRDLALLITNSCQIRLIHLRNCIKDSLDRNLVFIISIKLSWSELPMSSSANDNQ